MRKIPTLFRRDPTDRRRFLPEHQVALPPDAIATVKWDGTAVELDDRGQWWVRYETRPGRRSFDTHHAPAWPEGFRFVQTDPVTGKDVGWVPLDLDLPAHEVIGDAVFNSPACREPGTYEAIGSSFPVLVRHGEPVLDGVPTDFAGLRGWLEDHPDIEGIVWWADVEIPTSCSTRSFEWRPVAKVRRYDLGLSWTVSAGERAGAVAHSPVPASDTAHRPAVSGSPAEARP